MKKLALFTIALSCLLSCGGILEDGGDITDSPDEGPDDGYMEENPGGGVFNISYRIKPEKLDLSGSKYLFTTAPRTKAEEQQNVPGLFKVDENGNVTSVLFTCTQTEIVQDDTVVTETTTVRTDLSLCPDIISCHTKEYISIVISTVLDSSGGDSAAGGMRYLDIISEYYGGTGGKLHLLVRVSDGKIFFIPENAYWEFFCKAFGQLDSEGNLYLFTNYVVTKISADGESLILKKLNPDGMYFSDFTPLKNGTLFFANYELFRGGYLMYPNGSMDVLPDNNWDKFEDIYALKAIDGELKGTRVSRFISEGGKEKYLMAFCNLNVGTSRGSWSFESLASVEMDEWIWSQRSMDEGMYTFGNIYETPSHYIIGRFGKWDKKSGFIELFDDETASAILFPGIGNPDEYGNVWRNPELYKDRIWGVEISGSRVLVKWFDMEAVTYGEDSYDLSTYPEGFQLISHNISIATGEILANGINLTNLNKVTISLNIETGEMNAIETENSQEVINLIPLN